MNTRILHKDDNNKWVTVEKRYYDDEAHLQNLLTDDVNTLPLDEIGYDTKFVTIGKEVGLQNGSLDVLAISPQGHIALIETKLNKNPEVKRTVVGQILGYAAYLWNKSYEDIENNYFKKFLSQQKINFSGSLFDYMKEKLGDDSISEEEFRDGLEKRLRLGSFTLLIVVDQANQELIDIANYLNDRTGQEIDFYVIEMELVGDKEEQFLIPHLANPPRKNVTFSTEKSKSNNSYDRTPITKDELFSRLSDSGKKLAIALLEQFENSNDVSVAWGKNGFSIIRPIPVTLVNGEKYQPSFSFFFLKAGRDQLHREDDQIEFWYPDDSFERFGQIQPIVSEYVNFYRSLPGYDEKHVIKDLSVFSDDNTKRFIDLIEKTADMLNQNVGK
jgi:hypothetical protein